jgi:SsrA-binding protein
MATKLGKERDKAAAAAAGIELVMRNKSITHDYEVIDRREAGLVLSGSEVKSLRDRNAQWGDAHARIDDRGEAWLYGFHIGEYKQAAAWGHVSNARRKLLLTRSELRKLSAALQTKGQTLIPADLYFKGGWAKMTLCLCKGRNKGDKRGALIERERKRDVDRELARRSKVR